MKIFNISKSFVVIAASLIGTIKASLVNQKLEEIKQIKEDLNEYNNADCIA